MGVAPHEPYPAKTAGGLRAQERDPERPVLARAHVQPQNLSLSALAVDPDGYDHRDGGHLPVLAGLHVGGVEPDVRVGTLQRPSLRFVIDPSPLPRFLLNLL